MAVQNVVVSVGTSPTVIYDGRVAKKPSNDPVLLVMENYGAVDVFIGGETVSTTAGQRGLKIAPNASFSMEIRFDDVVYGIVAASTGSLAILVSRV